MTVIAVPMLTGEGKMSDDSENDAELGYHGTMKMSRADAKEIASWAKERVVRERMTLLEGIVRDLAAKKPPAYNGTCLLCHFADEDEEDVNHSPECPYRRAVACVDDK